MNNESSYIDNQDPAGMLVGDDNPEEISGDNNQSISNRHESVGSDIYNSESESVVINTNENYVEDYTNGVNIIPTTPTSAVSTTLSFVNAVGNIETTPNTETLDNTPPIKEIGHVQKKLQQIYENDPNIKENENTERLISKSEEDEIIVNDSDIVHQEIWDNNETTVSTAGSETSATIDEIIILETLQRYYGYLCVILNGVFVTTLMLFFTCIYALLLIYSLVSCCPINNPFKEKPAREKV